MIPLTLAEIAQVVNGELVGNGDVIVNQVSTDTRQLKPADLFIALKGPNFDAHKFVEQAEQTGCCAAIVEEQQSVTIPQIIVEDTRIALGLLGAHVKKLAQVKTVGITGSSGKTTVKEMVAAILSRLGNVLATKGNFNNDIGVPLTLLRLTREHDFAVIEMGANHIGEIAYTAELVKPDVAIINNVAAAHLEGFGDLAGVARAKGEIFSTLTDEGIAIYNADNKFASMWEFRLENKKVRKFSCNKNSTGSDVYAQDIVLDETGCASFKLISDHGSGVIQLTLPGEHNVCNAVAAATVAFEFGATIDDVRLGLQEMKPVAGRVNLHRVNEQLTVIDDTYNANIDSIKAAIALLANYSGRRILILGDMAELGEKSRQYHQQIGEYAKAKGIDNLLTLGVLSQSSADAFEQGGWHFTAKDSLMLQLHELLADEKQQVTILVKGSRSAHMEHVVAAIQQEFATNSQGANTTC